MMMIIIMIIIFPINTHLWDRIPYVYFDICRHQPPVGIQPVSHRERVSEHTPHLRQRHPGLLRHADLFPLRVQTGIHHDAQVSAAAPSWLTVVEKGWDEEEEEGGWDN